MEKKKNFKSNFIWNIIGTGFNAFNSLFFLVIVTRINGINEAGIFTLAFSTACILYIIGVYAGRVFQVTDINKEINDKEYIINRIISCILMILCSIGFVIIKKYDFYKSAIFVVLALYKCIEAFSDVLYGIMQKNDLLNKVGKSYLIKGIISLFVFILVDILTKNLILSCIFVTIIWGLVLIFYDWKCTKKLTKVYEKINWDNVLGIFKSGFFVFAITFLGLYIMNAPKYAIDNILTNDLQAIFGIIIMPATVMGLVGQFLIHPYLNDIVNLYKQGNIKSLRRLILKIILYILSFGIFAATIAYFLGIPVLNLVYGINLEGYQIHLASIIIASTMYNIGTIYSSVLTTIRKTFIQFVIYIITSLCAFVLSNVLTKSLGINGSTIAYFAIMFLQFILYTIIANIIMKKIMIKIGGEQNGKSR